MDTCHGESLHGPRGQARGKHTPPRVLAGAGLQSVWAATKGTLFIWQFKHRNAHVWAQLLLAGQLQRGRYHGDLMPLP